MNTNTSTKRKTSIGKALPFILATMLIMAMLVPAFATEHLPAFATEGTAGDLSEDAEVSEPSAEPVAPVALAEETAETTSIAALSAPATLASDVADVTNFSELQAAAANVNAGTINTINIQNSFEVTKTIVFDKNKTVTINGNGNTLTEKVTASNEFAAFEISSGANVDIKGLNFTGSEKINSAIHMLDENTNLSITGGTIKGFKGSALYLLDGTVTLKNVNFTDNNGSSTGGAVNAWRKVNATIDGCTFTGNSAASGGAIYASNYPNITITNTKITGNTATAISSIPESGNGGAIYAYVNSKVTIGTGTVIENNTAQKYGGAAMVRGSEFILDGGKISGNEAVYGGGIMAEGGSIVVKSGEISGKNTATYGGGIYAFSGATVDLLGGKISGNEAVAGGGIMTAGKSVVVKNGEISGNTAKNGGGIYAYNGATTDLLDGTFADNYADFGGAIFTADIQKLTANNVKFENNKAVEGYRWNLDDSSNSLEHKTDANTHKAKISNTTFTTPFTNAYNNYDVYYTFGGKELKYGKIIVEYYSDDLSGTPIAIRSIDKVYVGAEVEDTIISSLGADWLNAQRPAAGFKDGSVEAPIPTILESDADLTIKVLYSELPVEPEVPTPEPKIPAPTVNITQRIVETFPAEQVAQIEAQTGNPVIDVTNGNVPKGSIEAQGTWSLLNLLLAIICAVSFALMSIGVIRNKISAMAAKLLRFAAMVMGMFTIIIWAIIEDLTMPMSWINSNTAILIALFSVFAIVTVAFNIVKSRRNEKSKGEVVVA